MQIFEATARPPEIRPPRPLLSNHKKNQRDITAVNRVCSKLQEGSRKNIAET